LGTLSDHFGDPGVHGDTQQPPGGPGVHFYRFGPCCARVPVDPVTTLAAAPCKMLYVLLSASCFCLSAHARRAASPRGFGVGLTLPGLGVSGGLLICAGIWKRKGVQRRGDFWEILKLILIGFRNHSKTGPRELIWSISGSAVWGEYLVAALRIKVATLINFNLRLFLDQGGYPN